MALFLGLRELYLCEGHACIFNPPPLFSLEPRSLALALTTSMWLDSLQNLLCSLNPYLLNSSREVGSVNRSQEPRMNSEQLHARSGLALFSAACLHCSRDTLCCATVYSVSGSENSLRTGSYFIGTLEDGGRREHL